MALVCFEKGKRVAVVGISFKSAATSVFFSHKAAVIPAQDIRDTVVLELHKTPHDRRMFSNEQGINRYNYRTRFQEMEDKIKKCELERTQLEQKFSQLMRERQECEKAAARSLKLKYKRMLDLERQRAERNEELLRMLHKVDQQAASLAAKTDRLKLLKTQYESYLVRSWSSQRALAPRSPSFQSSPQPQIFLGASNNSANLPYAGFPNSPRSEFVKYLSDLTHVQTVEHNPYPMPMALANYIENQQQPARYYHPQTGPSWTQPTTQTDPCQVSELEVPPTPRHFLTVPQSSPRKFELSNEEFINYIDNEILKGPIAGTAAENIVTPSIVVNPPAVVATLHPTVAYLEDVVNDEDSATIQKPLDTSSNIIEELVEDTALMTINDQPSEVEAVDTPNQQLNSTAQMKEPPSQEIIFSTEEILENPVTFAELEIGEPKQLGIEDEVSSEEQVHETTDLDPKQNQNEYQPGYEQTNAPESDYPQQQYSAEAIEYEGYEPDNTHREYSAEDPSEYQYTYEQPVIEQRLSPEQESTEAKTSPPEGTNYWSTARQAIETKEFAKIAESRESETIEVAVDGDQRTEQPIRTESKRDSPVTSVPLEPVQEQEQFEQQMDPTQYEDYSQYQQEYDQSAEQEAYQYQQDVAQQQYPMYEDQSGAIEAYPEYAVGDETDPSQYQQATEYPGPTQYVYEQNYYDQQQPENQQPYDPNQIPDYYDPNAGDEQQQNYYTSEQQQQEMYDQTQASTEYNVASANVHESIPEEPEPVEQQQEEKQADSTNDPAAESDTANQPKGELPETSGAVPASTDDKNDTTISSVNDESDFDFSTQ
ncbi:transcription factor SPT20 homolog isoform X2 [Malaya genurostris]|uniref:transcription factor SPT20 homolog isoform X2 n=1 Tax=Malaya genurostris TaxID=325434 RepID=UPI0026F3DB8A|nr:transcription factor SPT20 homolog isoform X2 [Malaya genurostris]